MKPLLKLLLNVLDVRIVHFEGADNFWDEGYLHQLKESKQSLQEYLGVNHE